MSNPEVRVQLRQHHDFQFDIDFGQGGVVLRSDEPPPLGEGLGPTPVMLLAAAVGNCLSASLLFALRKFKQAPEPITTEVTAEIGRNAEGRLRVLRMEVALRLGVAASSLRQLDRVLGSFESYCTVTQSVAAAIDIAVSVHDADGQRLK